MVAAVLGYPVHRQGVRDWQNNLIVGGKFSVITSLSEIMKFIIFFSFHLSPDVFLFLLNELLKRTAGGSPVKHWPCCRGGQRVIL